MEYSVPMKRSIILLVLLALAGTATLGAQTTTPSTSLDYDPIRKGDQFIHVDLGLSVPLFYLTPDGITSDTNLDLGGAGRIGYSRFITSRMSLGGFFGFSFNQTLGENTYLALPMAIRASYEFVFNRIHVPVSFSAGGMYQTYRTRNYFGFMLKPEIGGYYRYSPDWSFGANLSWDFVPQWYDTSSDNRVGNFFDVMVGLRYHF
jgi:hypothetical protein